MTALTWMHANAPQAALLLAHGSGAPMDSPFMEQFVAALSGLGVSVARFEFAYMAGRRSGGSKRPPPRADKLIGEFAAAAGEFVAGFDGPVFIGGKSLGGRVAAMLAATNDLPDRVAGVVCIGYPFHPVKKPDALRLPPLLDARRPVLICQGTRDPFGNQDEIAGYALPDTLLLHWLEDGDHDFRPRAQAAATKTGNLESAAGAVAHFANSISSDLSGA